MSSLALVAGVRRLVDASPALVLADVRRERGGLRVRWTWPSGGAVTVEVGAVGERGARLTRGRVALRYELRDVTPSAEVRDAVLAAADAAADVVDGWLARAGGAELGPWLERDRAPAPEAPPALAAALGLEPGTALGAGFTVVDATPGPDGGVCIDLRARDLGAARARVVVRSADRVDLVGGRADAVPMVAAMRAAVGFLAACRLPPAVPVAPRRLELAPAGVAPAGPGAHAASAPEVAVVQVDSDCGQHCEFCAIPDVFAPRDRPLAELVAELERAHAAGARVAMLTGVDPLAHPAALELVAAVRALGFERLDLHGPGRRFAERDFAERLVAAAPAELRVRLPLYGATAATHDAVVARRGAFDQVLRALAHLCALRGSERLTLVSVCTRRVLPELSAIERLAEAHGVALLLRMPFPDGESRADRYFDVAPTMTEVARSLVASGARLSLVAGIAGMAPCVVAQAVLEHAPERRVELATCLAALAARGVLPTGARTPAVPCVHRATCALVPPCTGEVLGAYVACHGAAELVPPAAEVLSRSGRGP
ncbi:MAG: radical SAM protein [Polyangiaceae bacterium]|nr:radical SAM protein [Polyangiaceae bacterium]